MARGVFLCFDHQRDVARARVVEHYLARLGQSPAGTWDTATWTDARKNGDAAVIRLIDQSLAGTAVTLVLIGQETAFDKWVAYQIKRSYALGKAVLGVYVDRVADEDGRTSTRGPNPLDLMHVIAGDRKVLLSEMFRTFDWVDDDGPRDLGKWIEQAAWDAGK